MKSMHANDPRELSDHALDAVTGGADGMTSDASDFSFSSPTVPVLMSPGTVVPSTVVPVSGPIYYSGETGSTKAPKVKVNKGKGRHGQRHRFKGDDMTRAR